MIIKHLLIKYIQIHIFIFAGQPAEASILIPKHNDILRKSGTQMGVGGKGCVCTQFRRLNKSMSLSVADP